MPAMEAGVFDRVLNWRDVFEWPIRRPRPAVGPGAGRPRPSELGSSTHSSRAIEGRRKRDLGTSRVASILPARSSSPPSEGGEVAERGPRRGRDAYLVPCSGPLSDVPLRFRARLPRRLEATPVVTERQEASREDMQGHPGAALPRWMSRVQAPSAAPTTKSR